MSSNKIKLFKRIIIYLSIYYYFVLSNPQIQHLDKENEYLINEYKNYLTGLSNLREQPLNSNDSLILEEKENIFKFISSTINKNVSSVKRFILTTGGNFGNILICLNKFIFFCEIIGCTEILLKSKSFWFIRKKIFLRDYNLTIDIINDTQNQYYESNQNVNQETIYYDSLNILSYFYKIKPKIRMILLKDEITSNLPKLNISRNDLYIHIRSGDIFANYIHQPYAQPPLCFYEKVFYNSIFKTFNFNKIYLLSVDNNNPTIDKLLSKFKKNIIYSQNSLEYDLSCLINSYNLVGSISSFLSTIILLNSNLENLWEYNLYQMYEKMVQFHYELYDFPHNFTVYRMEASQNYKTKMYVWKNTKMQRKLMIKEKCINSFMIIYNNYKIQNTK